MLDRVFGLMSEEGRSDLNDEDRAFIKKRVRSLALRYLPQPERRFAKLDRVVCNIGGSRPWAPGSVQALNEEDPSDPTGQARLAYIVKIDPPDSRLVSVPKDTNDYCRAEICFGQRAGARWFTRMCLPKAIRKGTRPSAPRRFAAGDRVACAVEDATNEYTDWAAGTVEALDHLVEDSDGVPGGVAPYQVRLDSGPAVLVHADEHRLVRSLELQPAGVRIGGDGTRCVQRMIKRKSDDGWENVDHMYAGMVRVRVHVQLCARMAAASSSSLHMRPCTHAARTSAARWRGHVRSLTFGLSSRWQDVQGAQAELS